MNEGPGHVPLDKIPENMAKQLEWCRRALGGGGGAGGGGAWAGVCVGVGGGAGAPRPRPKGRRARQLA